MNTYLTPGTVAYGAKTDRETQEKSLDTPENKYLVKAEQEPVDFVFHFITIFPVKNAN
jgi:hypothetical protein